jgi:hypothetical protein
MNVFLEVDGHIPPGFGPCGIRAMDSGAMGSSSSESPRHEKLERFDS